jgi:hypothetical protein
VSFIFILLFISPFGKEARGDYAAAVTFVTVIGFASSLSFALYPKLLAKNCSEDEVTLSFKTTLMLAIPLATIALAMPKSLLTILKGPYGEAAPVLMLLTVDTLLVLMSNFYNSCILGVEHLDEEGKISLNKLVRSKIFKIFTIPYIQAAVALPVAYYVLTQLTLTGPVQSALYVIAINIGVHTSTLIGLYALMRKSIRLAVDWKGIMKYISAAIVAALVILITPTTTTLLLTAAKAITGLATYVAVLILIDKEARILLKQIWSEAKIILSRTGAKNNTL